jgi:ubiquinone/menaquinone biosynthesis C-methylase UbiE
MKKDKPSQNLQKYESKNPLLCLLLNRFYQEVNKVLKEIEPPKRVLDAGCGEGFAIQKLGKHFSKANIFGIDKSETALKIAKSIAPKMKTKKARIESIPFEDNYFDLVLALEVLEHIENPEKGLKEIRRVCRNHCIVSVPNEPWFSLCNVLRLKNLRRLGKNEEHLHFWNKKESIELIRKFFEIKKVSTSFPWVIFLCKK